jgi:sulfur carrier protein
VKLTVNGDPHDLAAEAPSVDDLVTALGIERRGVAIAVGDEVVPRSTWGERRLADGDRVEILTIAQGG